MRDAQMIKLDLGDPGYPQTALTAVARALVSQAWVWRYSPPAGLLALRQRLAEAAEERYGQAADPSWVVVTSGASAALAAVILATTEPGDEVLCPNPGYPAFSKSYALAGCRAGAVIAPPTLAEAASRAHWSLAMSASVLGQNAAVGALAAPRSCLADLRVTLGQRRDELTALFNTAGIGHVLPCGGFFFWLDIGPSGLDGAEFANRLAAEAGVRVSSETAFRPAGERFVRLSFGGAEDEVPQGAQLLVECYQRHTHRGKVTPR